MTNRVTATVKPGDYISRDDWRNGMSPWAVTLRYQGRRMTVPFYTGQAWTREPMAVDVLECLLSDASLVENTNGFEDWCAELGFDTDSRKAEQTFRQTESQTKRLRQLLGSDFEDFCHSEDQEEYLKSRCA